MNLRLAGPFPFDPLLPEMAARAALASAARGVLPTATARGPGLWLLVDDTGPRPTIHGFWLVAGSWWLRQGPQGAPDRAPPIFGALLDAAVEAVWWRSLPTAPTVGRTWRPLLVIEFPPELALRSALPPPGEVPPDDLTAVPAEDEGHWLLDEPARPARRSAKVTRRDPRLPRSLLLVARAHLEVDARAHEGRYFVLWPDRFPGEEPIPLATWAAVGATAAGRADPPPTHLLGPALELPGGGLGHPLSGWLTRSLEVWPGAPPLVVPGTLARRDVQSPRVAQFTLALVLTVLVFLPSLALALVVRTLAIPDVSPARTPLEKEAQPAISMCSADHEKFVQELRCQVDALARGQSTEIPTCLDGPGTSEMPGGATSPHDLQAAWCGLLDRALDGNTEPLGEGKSANAADFAAAQACFNVLGRPAPYALRDGPPVPGRRKLADPEAFLDDAELAVAPLQALVHQLTLACDAYRPLVEARVEGAVFATHVGLPDEPGAGEAATLRSELMADAIQIESAAEQSCFRDGAAFGPGAGTLGTVCGDKAPAYPPVGVGKMWTELGKGAPTEVVASYAGARFAGNRSTESALWRCHQDLVRSARPDPVTGAWDIGTPVAAVYSPNAGLVRDQLQLDETMLTLRGGKSAGACWSVVAARLDRYAPVHPLAGKVDPDEPWSIEQQVCEQTCAAYYRLIEPKEGWYTRRRDLDRCVVPTLPPDQWSAELGEGRLDTLLIPWSGKPSEQRLPRKEEICAFNLIAGGLMPEPEEGLLASGADRAVWAGQTAAGSQMAGGIDGAAAVGARNLTTYGRARSRETCANVATECFVTTFLDIARPEERHDPHEWPRAWAQAVASLPTRGADRSPWCSAILPFFSTSGTLPEGQLDYPCALGVQEARERVEASVRLAAGRRR